MQKKEISRISSSFKELKFLTLQQLYAYSVQIFMYKFHRRILPVIFNDFFMYNHQVHGHFTRQLHQLHVPKRKSDQRSKLIRFTGVHLSNYFDRHASLDNALPTYKKHLKTHILQSHDDVLNCLNVLMWLLKPVMYYITSLVIHSSRCIIWSQMLQISSSGSIVIKTTLSKSYLITFALVVVIKFISLDICFFK